MSTERIVIDNFLGGLAPSRYVGDPTSQNDPGRISGDSAPLAGSGWDPMIPSYEGILRRGYMKSTITNASFITGGVTHIKPVSFLANSYAYALSESSSPGVCNLHQIDISTSSHSIANSSPWPQTLPTVSSSTGKGMELFNVSGTDYLFYSTGRYLGRYDLSLTFNHCWNTSLGEQALGAYIEHPMAVGNGKLWIGNSNRATNTATVASVDGSGTINHSALDLSRTREIIKALDYNRNYLFIAASSYVSNNGSTVTNSNAHLYLWDTTSGSWQEQYTFPEGDITAVKVANGEVFCWGQTGFYRFTGSNFELLKTFTSGPNATGVDVSPRGIVYYRTGEPSIHGYGTFDQRVAPILFKPQILDSDQPACVVKWVDRNNLYVGENSSNFYLKRFSPSSETFDKTAEWRTPMINFGEKRRFSKIILQFLPWPSGTSLTVKWATGNGTSTTTIGTISTSGETEWECQADGLVGSFWQIILSHTAGEISPSIRRIIIEHDPDKT